MSESGSKTQPRWSPDDDLLRAIEVAKAAAIRDGRKSLSAADIAQGLQLAATTDGRLKAENQLTDGECPQMQLDESARDLLRPADETGRLTAKEVRARLRLFELGRAVPFDTVEAYLLEELRVWRLLAAAAEAQWGLAAFCSPADRHADPRQARSMRKDAARLHRQIDRRLDVTDWHPRRNPLAQLAAEHGLSRMARRCLMPLYLHEEFGIWAGRAPVMVADLARAAVETLGETDLVEEALVELADAGLARLWGGPPGLIAAAPTKVCMAAFRTAAAADCPSELLRQGSSEWLQQI